jgi:hypothetical protein
MAKNDMKRDAGHFARIGTEMCCWTLIVFKLEELFSHRACIQYSYGKRDEGVQGGCSLVGQICLDDTNISPARFCLRCRRINS